MCGVLTKRICGNMRPIAEGICERRPDRAMGRAADNVPGRAALKRQSERADVILMNIRRVLVVAALVASAVAGTPPGGSAIAAADTPDPAHPFSDPIWSPLRNPARVSCVKTNCDGPYHGYDAIDLVGELGDPIYAAGAGIFHVGDIDPGCSAGEPTRGTWVWVDHGPAGSTRYHHLDSIVAVEGQHVTPGTQIGTMGHSGDRAPCEINYLHMELRASHAVGTKLPITNFRACIDDQTVQLPQSMGFPTWDDVVPHVHFTPATDNSCLPTTWSQTPEQPGAVSIQPGAGSMTVSVPARPAGIDKVRVRLQLFHPSVGEYGSLTEQTVSPAQATAVFDDLLPNRIYRGFVSFHNSVGWSAWSNPVVSTTGFVPITPAFRDSDSSHTTIGYKWYRGSNADADYTVAIRRANGLTWGSWSYTEVPSTDLHYRFRDLQPGMKYQVTVRAHNQFGESEWADYHSISTLCSSDCVVTPPVITSQQPARLADSRNQPTIDNTHRNTGPRPGGTTWEIAVAGRAGVPAGATAAVLNLTVLNGVAHGYATVFPCGQRPTASSVNYRPGSIEPNEVIAKLSPTGTICVFTLTTADVIVDIVGHVANSPYRPLTPTRFADSRDEPTFDGAYRDTGRRRGGSVWEIPIAGRGTIPVSATTAVINVTATGAAGPGYATVFPCGSRPLASSLNFDAGITRPNELVAKLSPAGTICVYTKTDVDVIVDVVGYLGDVVGFTPLTPTRYADSRNATTVDGTFQNTGRRPAGTTWEIPIAGRAGVGAANAVVANITVTDALAPGFVTVYECGQRPATSTLNYFVGTTRPNETFAKLSAKGTLCVYTLTSAHIIVDVVGYTDD